MTVRRTLKPFTLDHFRAYVENIVLDNGEFWELEDFQCEIVEPILAGVPETWVIIPEGNGKTSLMAGVALYFCDYQIQPWIPIAASSRDQAEILAQQAYQMIRASPGMKNRFRIYEGYRKILPTRKDHPGPGTRGIKVYPADVTSGDGVIPTLALCDEGHRWPDMRLYRLWKGKLNKRKGQIVMISTAGEPGGDFEASRDSIRDKLPDKQMVGSHLCARGPRMVMHEWAVRSSGDITDMEKVKEANPLSIITEDTLREEFDSPMTDLGDWKRLKPLDWETPIPTPDGWTTMADLQVGDFVLNGEGLPTEVTATTELKIAERFEITFNDGSTIIASGDHLWEVEDARNHHKSKIVSTEEMALSPYMKDGRGATYARWRIRTVGRAVSTVGELPVDPYVLGVWLGDGANNTGHIRNGDPEVWDQLHAQGCEFGSLAPSLVGHPEKRMQTVLGLRTRLRGLGLRNNKHIPMEYLVASTDDRWALLQGLMDSDGTIIGDGRAIFWNTNEELARDTQRLAWSLGRPAMLREDRAMLNGRDCGPRFAVEISCDQRHPVVRLPRKLERLRDRGKTCDYRRVRSVVPVGKGLVRCIGVDAEDHLFLAGEAMVPTHNCNIPSRTVNAAITEKEWEDANAHMKIPAGEHIEVGCDVAWKHDTFAIVPMWTGHDDFRLLGDSIILEPPRDGSSMHPDEVKAAFEALNQRNPIDTVVIDMERAEDIAAWLEDELDVTVLDRPQGNANACQDYDAFMEGLRNGRLKHSGHLGLTGHALNAIARALPGDKKRFDRPSQSRARKKQNIRVIDALTAAAMVNWYVDANVDVGDPLVAWA